MCACMHIIMHEYNYVYYVAMCVCLCACACVRMCMWVHVCTWPHLCKQVLNVYMHLMQTLGNIGSACMLHRQHRYTHRGDMEGDKGVIINTTTQ